MPKVGQYHPFILLFGLAVVPCRKSFRVAVESHEIGDDGPESLVRDGTAVAACILPKWPLCAVGGRLCGQERARE